MRIAAFIVAAFATVAVATPSRALEWKRADCVSSPP